MSSHPSRQRPRPGLWWGTWIGALGLLACGYHLLGAKQGIALLSPADSLLWLFGAPPLLVSVVIRWWVLPHVPQAATAYPMFVFGMLMSVVTCLVGMCISASHEQELFLISALAVLQYVPVFARAHHRL